MSDNPNTPDQPDNPGQPDKGNPGVPPGYIEKARFDGLVRKVEELTLANREFQSQLAAKSSELEQLKTQLGIKETEKSAAVSERDKIIQDLTSSKSQLESEIVGLRALSLKTKVAREIGHPELIEIADTIPNLTDEEALKSIMQGLASFTQKQVKAREEQLLAGVTPPTSSVVPPPSTPQSTEEWQKYVNSIDPFSPDRQKAMSQWWEWEEAKHRSR